DRDEVARVAAKRAGDVAPARLLRFAREDLRVEGELGVSRRLDRDYPRAGLVPDERGPVLVRQDGGSRPAVSEEIRHVRDVVAIQEQMGVLRLQPRLGHEPEGE